MKKLLLVLAVLFGVLFVVSLGVGLAGRRAGDLQHNLPTVKRTVMTFAYKAYGNPGAAGGRFFLSKMVFTNPGRGPVRNFQISYQVPGYIPWTTPETQAEILPGQTVVKVFYPKFPAAVASLSNPANAGLEIKISWENTPGKIKNERLKRDFLLRGVNQFEFTSLPNSDVLTWEDQFDNADLLAAMITSQDPAVKAFVADVVRYAGGTTGTIGQGSVEEVARFMRAFYDYQVASGFVYTTADMANETRQEGQDMVVTGVQTVRLPRDVIQTGNGLCLELALLWAAVLKHVGIPSAVVVLPGHAFALAAVGEAVLPIECTGIGGAGIGGTLTFEQAFLYAKDTLEKLQQTGQYLLIDPEELQQQGIVPPDLPAVDLQELRNLFRERLGGGGESASEESAPVPEPSLVPLVRRPPEPSEETPPDASRPAVTELPDAPGNLTRFKVGDLFTFAIPKNWDDAAVEDPAWIIYRAEGSENSWMRVYRWTGLNYNLLARMAEESYWTKAGFSLTGTSAKSLNIGGRPAQAVTAVWSGQGQKAVTVALYVKLAGGGVAGFRVVIPEKEYGSQKPLLSELLNAFGVYREE